MRDFRFAALGLLGLAAWGGAADAQQTFAPLSVSVQKLAAPDQPPVADVAFSVSETYDSNVALVDDQLAAARGLKPADEILTPGVDFNLVVPNGLAQVFLKGDAGYSFYSTNHILDRFNADIAGGVTARVLSCQDTLIGDYFRRQGDVPVVLPQAIGNTATTGSVGVAVACGQKYGLEPSASVMETWNSNSAEVYRVGNSRTLTATAGLAYRNPGLGSLGPFGEYDDVHFDNAFLDVHGALQRDGYDLYTGGLRYEHLFGSRIGLLAVVAYTDLVPYISGTSDFQGLTYSLDLNYKAGPIFLAHANFSRAVLPTDVPFATFTVGETYEADINFHANRSLLLGLDGSAANLDYRGASLIPTFVAQHQNLYRVRATATYLINRTFRVALSAGEYRGDTEFPGVNFWSTRVGIQFIAAFGH